MSLTGLSSSRVLHSGSPPQTVACCRASPHPPPPEKGDENAAAQTPSRTGLLPIRREYVGEWGTFGYSFRNESAVVSGRTEARRSRRGVYFVRTAQDRARAASRGPASGQL